MWDLIKVILGVFIMVVIGLVIFVVSYLYFMLWIGPLPILQNQDQSDYGIQYTAFYNIRV